MYPSISIFNTFSVIWLKTRPNKRKSPPSMGHPQKSFQPKKPKGRNFSEKPEFTGKIISGENP